MSAAAAAFRPATASDLERVAALIVPDAASPLTVRDFRVRLDSGEYRADRVWVAESNGSTGTGRPGAGNPGTGTTGRAAAPITAAAIWWGRTGERAPGALDALVADPGLSREQRTAVSSQLLAVAHDTFARSLRRTPAPFHFLLPSDWRSRHDVVSGLSWRWEAALRAGLTDELERLRFEWRAETGLPGTARARLTFRREPDDNVFATLFRRALKGTLDATTRKTADVVGDGIQAHADVAFYRDRMEGDREWWIVAELRDGEPVGFGVPNRNSESAVVGYIGVLPEHRGQGYIDEILAETTRILATEGKADRVQADTDLANQPMAAAFERAGYVNFARRVVLSPPLR